MLGAVCGSCALRAAAPPASSKPPEPAKADLLIVSMDADTGRNLAFPLQGGTGRKATREEAFAASLMTSPYLVDDGILSSPDPRSGVSVTEGNPYMADGVIDIRSGKTVLPRSDIERILRTRTKFEFDLIFPERFSADGRYLHFTTFFHTQEVDCYMRGVLDISNRRLLPFTGWVSESGRKAVVPSDEFLAVTRYERTGYYPAGGGHHFKPKSERIPSLYVSDVSGDISQYRPASASKRILLLNGKPFQASVRSKIVFSPDDKWALMATWDRATRSDRVYVVNLSTGAVRPYPQIPARTTLPPVFIDASAILRSAGTRQTFPTSRPSEASTPRAHVAADGSLVVTVGEDNGKTALTAFDGRTAKTLWNTKLAEGRVAFYDERSALTPDGSTLVLGLNPEGTGPSEYRILDARTGSVKKSFRASRRIEGFALSRDGSHLVEWNDKGAAWRGLDTGEEKRTLAFTGTMRAAISPDNRRLVLIGNDKAPVLFDLTTGSRTAVPAPQGVLWSECAFANGGNRLIGLAGSRVEICDYSQARGRWAHSRTLLLPTCGGFPPHRMVVSPDGRSVLLAYSIQDMFSTPGMILVDLSGKKPVSTWAVPDCHPLTFTADGRSVFVQGLRSIQRFDAPTWR
jgi:outer membrane protein assembly factor BamB